MSFLTFPEANTEIAQEFVVITEWKKKLQLSLKVRVFQIKTIWINLRCIMLFKNELLYLKLSGMFKD